MIWAVIRGETGAAGGTLAPSYAIEHCSEQREHRERGEVAGREAAERSLETNQVREVIRSRNLSRLSAFHHCRCHCCDGNSGNGPPGDKTAGVENSWSGLNFGDGARAAPEPSLHKPPYGAAYEHRRGGRDRQVNADRNRQGLKSHQLDGDSEEHADQHESPR